MCIMIMIPFLTIPSVVIIPAATDITSMMNIAVITITQLLSFTPHY